MVLCKFFQQGNCRFGSKCHNDHIDIKQTVKIDIDAALNGKQWPFSTFGPFRDKPSIPNFITDQSFEEMRFLCYESKQKNFFEQFHQHFLKEAVDATNKMKALLQMTPDVFGIVCKLYDAPVAGETNNANNNNPFGMSTVGTTSSIFNKGVATSANNSIFGGGPTAGAGGNIFGQQAQAPSVFNSLAGQQKSIFGQNQTAANPLFGGATTGQQTSIFAQQSPTVGGLFGQATAVTTTVTTTANTNLFTQAGQTATAQPGFGLFAQAATSPQRQGQQPGIGQFGQQNLFAQAMPPQQQGGIFGQTAQPQPVSAINGGNLFGQIGLQQTGSMPAQIQEGAVSGDGSNASQQNLFTQALSRFQGNQPQQVPTNVFGQAVAAQQGQTPPPSGLFQQAMAAQQQLPSMFMQQQAQQQQQAQLQQQTAPNLPAGQNPNLYSKLEDLSPGDVEAFRANSFTFGQIPFAPPSRDFI